MRDPVVSENQMRITNLKNGDRVDEISRSDLVVTCNCLLLFRVNKSTWKNAVKQSEKSLISSHEITTLTAAVSIRWSAKSRPPSECEIGFNNQLLLVDSIRLSTGNKVVCVCKCLWREKIGVVNNKGTDRATEESTKWPTVVVISEKEKNATALCYLQCCNPPLGTALCVHLFIPLSA